MVILFACAPSYAQSGLPASDQIIKGCEQAVDELKLRRVEVDGLRSQIILLQDRDALREQYEANQAEQIAFWKTAATERKDALSIDDRIEKIRLEQIVEYRSEIDRLRSENEKLRRSRDKRFLIGTIIGTAAGAFIFK